jgi:hypothetical protein
MRNSLAIFVLISLCASAAAYGKNPFYKVVVQDAYIEMHTGPGGGYPVFHVADRGEVLEVHKRHTDWFKVKTQKGITGWVGVEQMARTLEPDGSPTRIKQPGREDYLTRRWETGVQLGDFAGANVISTYVAYQFTANISTELWGSHLSGDFSDGWMISANIVHQPFPEWRVSPFFTLGTGVLHIQPKATLVQVEDRTDQQAHVGFGLRTHLGRRFMLRAEYKSYVVFTSRDENEEVDEWKAGFAVFF